MFEDLKKEILHKPLLTNKEEILLHLNKLLRKATSLTQPHLLGLSGGVDSSLLALLSPTATKVIVGVKKSSDYLAASQLAQHMGWRVTSKILAQEDAKSIITEVMAILTKRSVLCDSINVGVGAVSYVLCQEAERQGTTTLMSGLGAEEIFGGYQSHVKCMTSAPDTFQDFCWARLSCIEQRDLARDQAIAEHFSIKLYAPFLNKELVTYAMQIAPHLKVQGQERKVILRECAERCGLPHVTAWRKKVAAQYGSGFDAVLSRLATTSGVKGKQAYLDVMSKKNALLVSKKEHI